MMSLFLLSLGLQLNTGCQSTNNANGSAEKGYGKVLHTEKGIASWYSVKTNRGTRTASGRRLKNEEMTAAHRRWAFGTPVKVTNLRNGRTVVVTITDRGPFTRGRVIDVTTGAARELGFYGQGLTQVKIEALEKKH